LEEAELHSQVERVRLSPMTLSTDDISNLWAAFQTEYRVSAAYQASVVLIDSTRARPSPLPVLRRGRTDPEGPVATAGPGPLLERATPDHGVADHRLFLPARPSDQILLLRRVFAGSSVTVHCSSARLPQPV